jgi:quinol monooxygenase YgiN
MLDRKGTSMLTAMSYVTPLDGHLDEVRTAIESARILFLGEPGCDTYNVDFEDGEGLVVEAWMTAEDFQLHIASDTYRALCAIVDPHLSKPLHAWPFDPELLAAELTIL